MVLPEHITLEIYGMIEKIKKMMTDHENAKIETVRIMFRFKEILADKEINTKDNSDIKKELQDIIDNVEIFAHEILLE